MLQRSFSLVYLSDYGEWDSHQNLRTLHAQSCTRIDKPVAGLLRDLKRRADPRDYGVKNGSSR